MPILEVEALPKSCDFLKERDLLQSRTPNDLAAVGHGRCWQLSQDLAFRG